MQSAEMSALKTLRSGFFYLSVATAMLVAEPVFTPVIFIYTSSLVGMMGMAVFVTVLMLSIVVIFLYAIFGKVRPGMRQLSEVDGQFRICYTGTTLLLVGHVILLLGLIVLVAVSATASFLPKATGDTVLGGLTLTLGVPLIGAIIAWIGNILTYVVGAFLLYSKYQNSLYMAAGILFVLDIALLLVGFSGILTFVGYILMYKALDNTINKLSTAAATPAQT